MSLILAVLVVLLAGLSGYLLLREKAEAKTASSPREDFQNDMQYVAGEIKKLYEERAQILAENDRLKRDLEELRKKSGLDPSKT